jgi:di/tricarboxylate transporter
MRVSKHKNLIVPVLSALVTIFAVLTAIVAPFDGLGRTGHIMLASVAVAVVYWILRPGNGVMTIGAVIILLGGTIAGVPMSDLASGFSGASLWMLISAMLLGYALLKTGLGKRIVFGLFKRLELNYVVIMVGWLVTGILFSLLTASITVRVVLLTPIALSVADACCLPEKSKGRSLIIISAYGVSIFPGIAWLNGSLFGPVFTSYLPSGLMREMATEQAWLQIMGLPWMLLSVLFLAVIYFVLKPDEKLSVTKTQLSDMYRKLGTVSRDEKVCAAVFVLLLVGLALQSVLPITTNQVLFVSLGILLFCGVFSVKDISTGVSWDIVVFFGILLSFSRIFEVSGITVWLSPILSSLLIPIAAHPVLFLVSLYGICLLLRFLDVAQGWIIAAILSMATPALYTDFGIHPLFCVMVFICAANLFFFRYHQPWLGQVEAICGDNGWASRHLAAASVVYAIVAVVILVFCRFYWQIIGIW